MVKKWILKAVVQKTISFLPFNHHINYFFQKYVTKGVYLSEEYFYDRLGHARDHLNAYTRRSNEEYPKICLEIGTGWYPIVPISFFLAGAERIYSVDISFLTSKNRLLTTLIMLEACYSKGLLSYYYQVDPERMDKVKELIANIKTMTLEEVLEELHILYLIEDARKLSLKDDSIDLINSNNTFEHIYPKVLIPILKEFKRIVKKRGGVMSHFIDMSDHFAHFDKTINIYNFLQYSDIEWMSIDNSIQPQNRLRIYDYKKIYADLNIPINQETFRAGDIEELKSIELDLKFATHDLKEVAISHCHLVSY